MRKIALAFSSLLARILPLSAKQALYRFPPLARLIRKTINASVDDGLSIIEVAAGPLKGYKMELNLRAEKSRWLGTYEPDMQAALDAYLFPGMVAYDVGANIGYISLMMARVVGNKGAIVAFEALPANVERVKKNITLNKVSNISVISAAVIDRTTPVKFYIHSSIGMGKAAGSAGRSKNQYKGEITVPGLALDEFVFNQGGPVPDVIKMDIEGGEVLALPGMKRILSEYHPLLLLELHGQEAEKVTWETLTTAGYSLYSMHEGYPRMKSAAELGWKAYVIACVEK